MFLNKIMLVGVGAAVVPLVLHLLSRARFRTVDWAAMMFLDGVDDRPLHRGRLRQWALLALRAAIVCLLAIALARPVLRGKTAAPRQGQAVVAAVILDCSASMGVDENGHTRMVLARGAAKQVLGLHEGDRISLVLMGPKQPPEQRAPTADLWDVARRIEAAEPTDAPADAAAALRAAAESVSEYAATLPANVRPFVDVYVITDRQGSTWDHVDDAFRDEWRASLRAAGLSARLFLLPVGGADADNVAIDSLKLLNAPAVINQPAEIEVNIHNYGKVKWSSLPLTVTPAGGYWLKSPDARVNLPPGSDATLRGTAIFRTPGTHVVSATVKSGGLSVDDRYETSIDVRDPVKILVISGDAPPVEATPQTSDRGTDYLRLALAPMRARSGEKDPAAPDVAAADDWSGPTALSLVESPAVTPGEAAAEASPDAAAAGAKKPSSKEVRLADYDVVVLADVESFTPSQSLAIEQFVYDGGGVLIAPGALSRPKAYNETLYRGGSGILPAALKEPTAADGSEETYLSGCDTENPIFKFVGGRPDSFLTAGITRYFPVEQLAPAARELAYYVTGDPFLVATSVGKGRVLLVTTSLDADWSTLPLSNFYLPFIQSAVRHLADTAPRELNLRPGQPIELQLDNAAGVRGVSVFTPDRVERPAELSHAGSDAFVRFTETDRPGQYIVHILDVKKPIAMTYIVRRAPEESNLSPLSQARSDWLSREMGVESFDPAERPIATLGPEATAGMELWAPLLGAVLTLTLIELLVVRIGGAAGREEPPTALGASQAAAGRAVGPW